MGYCLLMIVRDHVTKNVMGGNLCSRWRVGGARAQGWRCFSFDEVDHCHPSDTIRPAIFWLFHSDQYPTHRIKSEQIRRILLGLQQQKPIL